jgi:hypothetical protein
MKTGMKVLIGLGLVAGLFGIVIDIGLQQEAADGGFTEAVAKRLVASQMRDPDSVEFQNVGAHVRSDGSHIVCGEVNAKNGFGAYVGYVRFIAFQNGVVETDDPAKPGTFDEGTWQTAC